MQLKRCSSVKKLPIMYVLDRYKTREVCDKVVPENVGILRFVLACYKNKKCSC